MLSRFIHRVQCHRFIKPASLFQPTTFPTRIQYYATQSSHPSLSLDPMTEKAQEWMDKGNALFEKNDMQGAIDCYQKSVWTKTSADAYYNMGNCYCMLGQYEKGVDAWNRSLSLDAHRPDAHVNIANVYAIHLKNMEKALEHYEAAIQLDGKDGEIHYNYAAVLDFAGRLEQAQEYYQKAVDLGVSRAQENLRNVTAKIKEKSIQ